MKTSAQLQADASVEEQKTIAAFKQFKEMRGFDYSPAHGIRLKGDALVQKIEGHISEHNRIIQMAHAVEKDELAAQKAAQAKAEYEAKLKAEEEKRIKEAKRDRRRTIEQAAKI